MVLGMEALGDKPKIEVLIAESLDRSKASLEVALIDRLIINSFTAYFKAVLFRLVNI